MLQSVLAGIAEEAAVEVRDVTELDAARLGISIAPVLRIQRGSDTLEWLVQFDRGALAERLNALGVPLK